MDDVDQMVRNVAVSGVARGHILVLLTVERAKDLIFGLIWKQRHHLELKTFFKFFERLLYNIFNYWQILNLNYLWTILQPVG